MYDQISICPKRSSYHQRYTLLVNGLIAVCLIALCNNIFYALLLLAIQLCCVLHMAKRIPPAVMLLCKRQQFWLLSQASGDQYVELRQTLVWPWVCCLTFYSPAEKKHYFFSVFNDAVEPEEWRKLRVLLLLAPLKKARLS